MDIMIGSYEPHQRVKSPWLSQVTRGKVSMSFLSASSLCPLKLHLAPPCPHDCIYSLTLLSQVQIRTRCPCHQSFCICMMPSPLVHFVSPALTRVSVCVSSHRCGFFSANALCIWIQGCTSYFSCHHDRTPGRSN